MIKLLPTHRKFGLWMTCLLLLAGCSSETSTTESSPPAAAPVSRQVALPEQLAGRSIHFYLNHPAIDEQAKAYAKGTFQPSDDQATFALLDSLTTDNEETRPFYYFVFSNIMLQADGALAEVVGSYAMSYAEKFPAEYYRKLAQSASEILPRTWADYIGYEVLMAQAPNQVLQSFIQAQHENCSSCPPSVHEQIDALRSQLQVGLYRDGVLPLILAKAAQPGDRVYVASIPDLQTSEAWGMHAGAIGSVEASSQLAGQKNNTYSPQNLSDLDLKTAWVEGAEGLGEGVTLTFTCAEAPPTSIRDFNGELEIFNGYCKSEKTWQANGRVQRLRVSVNGQPLCHIVLQDTWQYQHVDLSHLITGKAHGTGAVILKAGDQLQLEIESAYPGDAYEDVALSELVTPSYGGA